MQFVRHPPSAICHPWLQSVDAEVRPQNVRHNYGAVRLLIMLKYPRNDPWKRQPGAVQCVDEPRLLTRRRSITDVRTSSLEVGERAAGRNLQPLSDAGSENLEIVAARGSEAGITGGKQHATVRKAGSLEQRCGVPRQARGCLVALLRRAVAHHFDLVELVDAQQPAGVLP